MRATIKVLAVGIFGMLGMGLHGCGAGSDQDLAKFTGTWRAISGTSTIACPGAGATTTPVASNIVWARGVSSDLVQALTSTTCVINADVTGATASGDAPPCTIPNGDTTITLTLPNYTFVISPDGHTAAENASGTFVVNGGGATATCSISQTASYQKIGQ